MRKLSESIVLSDMTIFKVNTRKHLDKSQSYYHNNKFVNVSQYGCELNVLHTKKLQPTSNQPYKKNNTRANRSNHGKHELSA